MNVQHERNLHLRSKLDPRIGAQLEMPWRTNGLIAQCVFFVLACVALGASYGLAHVLHIPKPGIIVGFGAIAVAELLIARRWFFTGVEAALWIVGLILLITELPSSGKPEALLVFAAACAIAGARVRNPLFGGAAAIFVMIYVEDRFDGGVICALAIALAAVLALLRTWQRPSTEHLWIVLALVMPFAGRFTADSQWWRTTIVLYAVYGAAVLALAILRRHHGLFLSAMIALAIAATDAAMRIELAPEVKFAIAGGLLLAIAFAVSRALRGRTHGFVLTPMTLTPLDDAIESGATIALQPATPVSTTPQQEGGAFGGAGASGDY